MLHARKVHRLLSLGRGDTFVLADISCLRVWVNVVRLP